MNDMKWYERYDVRRQSMRQYNVLEWGVDGSIFMPMYEVTSQLVKQSRESSTYREFESYLHTVHNALWTQGWRVGVLFNSFSAPPCLFLKWAIPTDSYYADNIILFRIKIKSDVHVSY